MKRKTAPTSRERRLATVLRKLMVEHNEVRLIGAQMSNVMFNLAQRPGQPAADTMRQMREKWDAIKHDGEQAALRVLGATDGR